MIAIEALWEGILDSCRSCLRQLLLCLAQSECLNALVNIPDGESVPALQRLPLVIAAAEGIKLYITNYLGTVNRNCCCGNGKREVICM